MKIGGKSTRGENYLDAAFFHADRKEGGCGSNWVRTTKQGTARNHRKGINAKWPTRSALVGAYIDVPSTAFRDNYDCVFGRCGCTPCGEARAAGLVARCSSSCIGHRSSGISVEYEEAEILQEA